MCATQFCSHKKSCSFAVPSCTIRSHLDTAYRHCYSVTKSRVERCAEQVVASASLQGKECEQRGPRAQPLHPKTLPLRATEPLEGRFFLERAPILWRRSRLGNELLPREGHCHGRVVAPFRGGASSRVRLWLLVFVGLCPRPTPEASTRRSRGQPLLGLLQRAWDAQLHAAHNLARGLAEPGSVSDGPHECTDRANPFHLHNQLGILCPPLEPPTPIDLSSEVGPAQGRRRSAHGLRAEPPPPRSTLCRHCARQL